MQSTSDSFRPDSLPDRLPEISLGEPIVVPVIEERVIVNRETVESGRVRLVKDVHQHDELVNLMLQHDEVQVERVAVDQFLADEVELPTSRHEGDTLIIPVLREVVVTRVLLVEEIRVTKRQVSAPYTENVSLRREEVRVERQPANPPPSDSPNS